MVILDKILGMIHIRDLFQKINKAKVKKIQKISKKMIRTILFFFTINESFRPFVKNEI